jgi:pantoate--beta-alanine ligase
LIYQFLGEIFVLYAGMPLSLQKNIAMKIVKKLDELNEALKPYRNLDYKIGFVPTMGALHQGHLSLIKESRMGNQVSVVSIFVNPTQFNDKNDLKNYPRTPEADLGLLDFEGVDVVFMPEVDTIYPDDKRNDFDLNGLDEVMEGLHRPGHFQGVADVVYRLFDMVKPNRAYFGEKDFQQLRIIQYMTMHHFSDLEIISCDTLREPDGLAMSSRNMRLSAEQRMSAPMIYKLLKAFEPKQYMDSPRLAEKYLAEKISEVEHLSTEYVSIVEDDSLISPKRLNIGKTYRVCVAAWCGKVRLIDNLTFVI